MPHLQTQPSCPPDVLELLPWYPDHGLTPAERGAVEAHAAACAECRREIHESFRDVELPADAPSPERVLARVFDRIAAGDGAAGAPARLEPPVRIAPAAPRRPRRRLPLRPVWAAAAALALAAAIGFGAVRLFGEGAGVYVTATAPPGGRGAADGAVLDVVLRGDASARELSEALRGIGGEIVSGPSDLGRYQVRLPSGADASAAAMALGAEGSGIASFAAPIPR